MNILNSGTGRLQRYVAVICIILTVQFSRNQPSFHIRMFILLGKREIAAIYEQYLQIYRNHQVDKINTLSRLYRLLFIVFGDGVYHCAT